METMIQNPAVQGSGAKKTGTKRNIRKVAVLGSGVMGSRIACHFANIGVSAVLLDIVPFNLTEEEKNNPAARNRLVNDSLSSAIKGRPSPLYHADFASRIATGNFDDNFDMIAGCDLIIEAVIERLDIKKQVFEKVEKYRKPGSIVATNTSGIPIHMMNEGRSDDFNRNFVGLHFFNPPRYLRLLEVIPTPLTDPEITDFMMHYGDLHLGKKTVLAKDTPAFIANRVGIFALLKALELVESLGLTVEETDKLTGPATGKPNTGTFRLADLIGIDTTLKVKQGLAQNLPHDEAHALFAKESVIERIVEKGWFGDKSGQGYYKKSKDASGNTVILSMDLKTMEYRDNISPRLPSLGAVKTIENLNDRLRALYAFEDKGGEFVRKSTQALCAYVSNRVPEIADDLFKIDDGIKAGFAWDIGAFEAWDVIGVRKVYDDCLAAGIKVAAWVKEMLDAGNTTFYKVENGARKYWDLTSRSYKVIPGTENLVILDNLRESHTVWKNSGAAIFDLGDGVLNVEFQTKANSIGGEVLEAIHKGLDLCESGQFAGLVIGNSGPNFSLGANLAMMLMLAIEQEWEELDMAVRTFQNTSMRIRTSNCPVVVAPHGMALGGGCEFTMHADQVVAAAETYIGLVEVGVGLIPAGGGTKELTLRISDAMEAGDVQLNSLQNGLLTIAQAKVATSAVEAFDLKIFKPGNIISVNIDRRLKDAKTEVLRILNEGYTPKSPRQDITVLGQTGLGLAYSGVYGMYAAGWATEHDMKVAKKVAWIMCGGDLSGTQKVSEQYLLDLEREAFLSLCGEQKTLERIQHTLKTGKPLRN